MTSTREHVLSTAREHRWRILLASSLSIAHGLLLLPVPLLLGYAFDTALPDERKGLLVAIAAATAVVVAVSGVTQVVSMHLQIGVATRIGFDLRRRLYRRLFDAPRELFDQSLVSTVHDRVVNDSLRSIEMYGAALNKIVPDVIVTVGVAVILVVLDWKLAVVTLAFLPVLLVVSRFMIRRQHPAVRAYHSAFRDLSARVMLVLRSQDLIRISGSEGRELETAETELEHLKKVQRRFELIAAAHHASQQTVIGLAGAALLVAGGYAVIDTQMEIGELLAFYAAFALLRGPAGRAAGAYGEVIGGWQAYGRVVEFLEDPLELPYTGDRKVDAAQELVASDVSFGYDPDHLILEGLTLRLRPGRVAALVGPNGSGKSTFVDLLLGFYRPSEGSVSVDGIPFDDVDLHHLRSQFGVVRQEPFLLPGTILENVTYGANDDPAALDRALALSGADAVIASLPKGLQTVVGEDGHLLSGGQRQRIAIARALMGDPRILILDEPTNHLDERAIADLLERLEDIRSSMAVLLISHQRAMIDLADDVVELESIAERVD